MAPAHRSLPKPLPVVDLDFLRVFLPYELLLAQRRAMVWGSRAEQTLPNANIGLYLVRLEPLTDNPAPAAAKHGPDVQDHVDDLLQKVLRESDIPARLGEHEHLAVLRDIDPQHAYAVAQRFLSSATSSRILERAKVRARVGYLVYPLSLQPDFPADRWTVLLELARRMSRFGDGTAAGSGYGLLRGPQISQASIPESDLIPLAYRNLDVLVTEGILQIQRIQLIGGK